MKEGGGVVCCIGVGIGSIKTGMGIACGYVYIVGGGMWLYFVWGRMLRAVFHRRSKAGLRAR